MRFVIPSHVSDQSFIAGSLFSHDHRGFFYRRVHEQHRFDLTRFDSEPANLYLMVLPAEELNISIRQIARVIARFVNTITRVRSE